MRRDVAALFTSTRPPGAPDLIGIEIELIPVMRGPDPRPVPLFASAAGAPSLLGLLRAWAGSAGLIREERRGPADLRFRTSHGGWITFEPGGQLELSSAPRPTPSAAFAEVVEVLDPLHGAAYAAGVKLMSRGLNPWHDVQDIPLQVESPRYRAMDAYLRRYAPDGARMMRLTAAMQINLDFGSPAQTIRRWRAANLLSPVIRGSFANSRLRMENGNEAVSGRSVIWERTDTSRTGALVSTGSEAERSPSIEYLDFARAAHVMIRRDTDGTATAAEADLQFDDWWRGASPPAPEVSDWETHLSTLFPDVRPRGWLELRAIDAPRREWWAVPLTVLPALLLDDEAVSRTLETLEPMAPRIADLASRAGVEGLRVGPVGEAAEHVFAAAIEAAHRSPPGYFSADMLAATEDFFQRYVVNRRTQADDESRIDA
jgi:glutamate--cysteine ligase